MLGGDMADKMAEIFRDQLRQIQEKHQLPALAAALALEGKIAVVASAGDRKLGVDVPVTDGDRWHIGSCTKSMTATLAAMLVQRRKLKWEVTVGEMLGGSWPEVEAGWKRVTLEQLLTHRSGAARMPGADLMHLARSKEGCATKDRVAFARLLVSRKPALLPGANYVYSNQGYVIAAAMLEVAAGCAWEDLIRKGLFEPLGMKSAGFGPPGSPGKIDEPWGHTSQLEAVPHAAADDAIPRVMAPAGSVHCSPGDFVRYAAVHAAGEREGAVFLAREYFVKLHAPGPGQTYAMGWGTARRAWAGGVVLTHTGTNRLFYSNAWIALAKNAALFAVTNAGGDAAARGTNAAITAMIKHWLAAA